MENPFDIEQLIADAEAEQATIAAAARQAATDVDLKDLAQELVLLKDRLEELSAEKTAAQARYDDLRRTIIPDKLRAMGLVSTDGRGSFNFAGGKLTLTRELHVSVRAMDREQLVEYLKAHGAGSLVKESVNDQTLKAHCRALREEGKDLPPMVNVFEDHSITLRRDKASRTGNSAS